MAKNDDTTSRRGLLKIAATAAAAAPVGAAALPAQAAGADAELLRLCAEYEADAAAAEALMEPYYDVVDGWPADVGRRLGALTARQHGLAGRIAACRAKTPAGAAARARLALRKMDLAAGGLGTPGGDDLLPWSVCRDVLALAEGAA